MGSRLPYAGINLHQCSLWPVNVLYDPASVASLLHHNNNKKKSLSGVDSLNTLGHYNIKHILGLMHTAQQQHCAAQHLCFSNLILFLNLFQVCYPYYRAPSHSLILSLSPCFHSVKNNLLPKHYRTKEIHVLMTLILLTPGVWMFGSR